MEKPFRYPVAREHISGLWRSGCAPTRHSTNKGLELAQSRGVRGHCSVTVTEWRWGESKPAQAIAGRRVVAAIPQQSPGIPRVPRVSSTCFETF
jgi:hypothetical protein